MSHVSGGSLMPRYSDVTSCQDACKRNINCRTIDFNFDDNTCWFHYDDTVCNPVIAKNNCVHYKYVSCDRNKHVIGGTLQRNIIDVTSCINACVETCLGVDFNSADSTCWFHKVTTACRHLEGKRNCTHYSRVDCQSECSYDVSKKQNRVKPL
ncbi:hypothetical protein LSH36_167g04041 [Paralvinella palmiformis]|uniref:Apple domain-containing protein n=1 Tax=Paralvinella palmiformis TaxID=53620 RepID=A0AAD9JSL7_9ANNE|nr:hypothetical protein LSH36_167g04041 [Paralvinella palmiformis]